MLRQINIRTNHYGGHGGIRAGGSPEEAQGRYDKAQFAGMGGQWYGIYNDARGGGLIKLVAKQVDSGRNDRCGRR